MKIVLASGNAGKLVEMREILGGAFELVAQGDMGIADVDETGATFVENAILKARNAARLSGLPSLGDDSGLCADALDGAPGLYSARYAGGHGDAKANIAKLLDALRGKPDRSAYFYCCVVLLRHADDPAPIIGEGRWFGRILEAPRGDRGFGYDPVFLDPLKGPAGDMDSSIKNTVSHRAIALKQLHEQLKLL